MLHFEESVSFHFGQILMLRESRPDGIHTTFSRESFMPFAPHLSSDGLEGLGELLVVALLTALSVCAVRVLAHDKVVDHGR